MMLLPVCLEATKSAREMSGDKDDELTKKVSALFEKYKSTINNDYLRCIIEYCQLSSGNAAFRIEKVKPFGKPFAVVVLEGNVSGHGHKRDVPYILTHALNKLKCLTDAGEANNYYFTMEDAPRLATDTEIEECLDNLNLAQLKAIMTDPLFAAIVAPLWEEQDELVAAEVDSSDDPTF